MSVYKAGVHTGHPLDPLSALEIKLIADQCKAYAAHYGYGPLRFNTIGLKEPTKASLLAFEKQGPRPAREAEVVLTEPPKSNPIEVVVDLDAKSVTSFKKVDGVLASIILDDFFVVGEAMLKGAPEVQTLCADFGIPSMDHVAIDTWPIHPAHPEDVADSTKRRIMGFMYYRSTDLDNIYAHPLPWLPIMDVETRKIVKIECAWKGQPPFAKQDFNYHHKLVGPTRADIKPLNILQPEGPSFTVEGNLIKWQRWHIRIGFTWREGLVIYNVAYEDEGRLRPILNRASIAEMAVPYGEPQEPFHRRLAFDIGDLGLGVLTNSLELGCDCLGSIHYFDALMANSKGEPFEIKKAVCLHEEDAGVIWKHTELRTMHPEARRGRRLVISTMATVANYEYGFNWYFGQDGTIQHEVKLTGEVSTTLASPEDGTNPKHGTMVAPHVVAAFHQHLFCARLDMAVDDAEGGKGLVVSEVEAELLPEGKDNPWGNAFVKKETDLLNESTSGRLVDPMKSRFWKIRNPAVRHEYSGHPIAYKLMPANTQLLLAHPSSTTAQRASFATKSLWVTPHSEAEKYPGGEYPLQNVNTGGVAEWVKQGRSIAAGSDPVVWHVFGATHLVRPEDFPVMPVETVGFHLKPVGFFKHNPALDIPHTINTASKLASHCCGALAANGHTNGHANGHINGHANGHSNGAAVLAESREANVET